MNFVKGATNLYNIASLASAIYKNTPVIQSAATAIKDEIVDLKDNIGEGIDYVGGRIGDGINYIGDGINDLKDAVSDWVGPSQQQIYQKTMQQRLNKAILNQYIKSQPTIRKLDPIIKNKVNQPLKISKILKQDKVLETKVNKLDQYSKNRQVLSEQPKPMTSQNIDLNKNLNLRINNSTNPVNQNLNANIGIAETKVPVVQNDQGFIDGVGNYLGQYFNTIKKPFATAGQILGDLRQAGDGLAEMGSGEWGDMTVFSGFKKLTQNLAQGASGGVKFAGQAVSAGLNVLPLLLLLGGGYYAKRKIFDSKTYNKYQELKRDDKLTATQAMKIIAEAAGQGALESLSGIGNVASGAYGLVRDSSIGRGIKASSDIARRSIGNQIYNVTNTYSKKLWNKLGVRQSVWTGNQRVNISNRIRQLQQKKNLNKINIQKAKSIKGTPQQANFPKQFDLETIQRQIDLQLQQLRQQYQIAGILHNQAVQREKEEIIREAEQKKKKQSLKLKRSKLGLSSNNLSQKVQKPQLVQQIDILGLPRKQIKQQKSRLGFSSNNISERIGG